MMCRKGGAHGPTLAPLEEEVMKLAQEGALWCAADGWPHQGTD